MIHQRNEIPRREPAPRPPIGSLFTELKDEFAHLVKTTTMLLRQELEENVDNAAAGLRNALVGFAVMLIAGLMAIAGIDLLLIALLAAAGLSYATAAWVATLGLASLLGLGGYIVVKRNQKKLTADKLVPHKTLATIEEHADWIAHKAGDLAK